MPCCIRRKRANERNPNKKPDRAGLVKSGLYTRKKETTISRGQKGKEKIDAPRVHSKTGFQEAVLKCKQKKYAYEEKERLEMFMEQFRVSDRR